ncbi:glycosyl transferase family, a/b domain-containing protein [Schizophyllum amplum]|uniref:Anthranilate phosphoribosyltransferase n=1 Tax=Schizophyllum amplum TaxID=97359 RepID=A0A550CUU4_9AGAR|nr:glycosyl transferase family, a/b domain-containing protein [Auriculariopsis ampla]
MADPKYSQDTFKPLLNRVAQKPEYFTAKDLRLALEHVFTPGALPDAVVGAFLTALHLHRIERRPEMLQTAASVLRERALKADVEKWDEDFVVDIVGTGGDGYSLFNVSTTAAIVAAGAGARVIKHGSRASTSASGSADLLQSLDCLFPAPSPDIANPIPKIPFTFILAPHYHPALAHLAPYRKALPFRTMFNVLGPLLNPAKPKGMVLGVAEKEIGETFARSVKEGGVQRAMVVCGYEGLDEISCASPTRVWMFDSAKEQQIRETTVSPADFGLKAHPLADVAGTSPEANAHTFERLLRRQGTEVEADLLPVLDFVLMNASALLVVAGVAKDFKEGVAVARASVVNGKAWEALEIFREQGQKAAVLA